MSKARACVGEGNGDLRSNGSFRNSSSVTAARETGGRRKRERKEQRTIRGNIEGQRERERARNKVFSLFVFVFFKR